MTFKHEFASVLLLCWHADVVLSVFWKPPELRMLKDDVTPTPSTSQRSRNSAWVWGSAAFLLWKNTPHSQEFPSPAAVALMWRSARRSSGVGGKGINLTSASFQNELENKGWSIICFKRASIQSWRVVHALFQLESSLNGSPLVTFPAAGVVCLLNKTIIPNPSQGWGTPNIPVVNCLYHYTVSVNLL